MKFRAAFCSLSDVARQFLEDSAALDIDATEQAIIDSWDSAKKAFFKELILDVSDKIGTLWRYSFVPFNYSYTVHAQDREWCGWWLTGNGLRFYLSELEYADALALSAVTSEGVLLAATDYRLMPYNSFPAWAVSFNRANVAMPTSTDFDTKLILTGTWGYHESPATMWRQIGTLVAGGLTSSATTITDNAMDDLAEIYGYWQIEDETVFITDVNLTNHVITIERGALGTTAVSHLAGVAIKKFMPMPQVVMAVRRLVVLLNNKKDETGDVTVIGDTTIQVAGESIKLDIPRKEIWGSV